ncbi:MAG: sensor histidine kinase [Nevskiales bacterium]
MSEPVPDAIETLEQARTALAERDALVESLTLELAETNQGVVALYADLEDQALQLIEASELKSRFLSYMSHEFRTPLSAMRSITRFLLERLDGPLTEEQARQVLLVQTAAVELNDMVDDLLDLAKVEAGRVSIAPEWFELVNLFGALHGMFRPLLHSDAVKLVFGAPDDVPKLYTDDRKLAQILRNFVSNALKFTTEGEVRVDAQRLEGERVKFTVTDTGTGIAPEQQGGLFKDFSQLDSPLQKRLRGTGLGLSLSKKLAELLGGSVGVDSELGKGSAFWVTIPIEYRSPEQGQEGK